MFLSKAERDYLTANSEISVDYSRVIKSRLQKKIERFASEELPLLIEKGLIPSSILDANVVTKFRNSSVTENCNGPAALVAQLSERKIVNETVEGKGREEIQKELIQ